MSTFNGRTALITGAGSGIGAAIAGRLRAAGASVVTTGIEGDVDHELDVRDLDAFRSLVDETGVPDLLFANAGISMGGPTHELTRAHWDRIIDVNLNGVVNGLLAVYPGMVARGSGHIVATASAMGLGPAPFVTSYSATKHAVVGMCVALRSEASLHGVQVSVLCPGAVETPILDRPPAEDLPLTPTKSVTARQYLDVVKQKPVASEKFARLALRGVERNRAVIVEPASARALWYTNRLAPGLVGRLSAYLARRVDRDLVSSRE